MSPSDANCDRCGEKVGDEATTLAFTANPPLDVRSESRLCPACARSLRRWFQSHSSDRLRAPKRSRKTHRSGSSRGAARRGSATQRIQRSAFQIAFYGVFLALTLFITYYVLNTMLRTEP